MSEVKLHILKPSVNNMTARVFVRAAKLDFTEDDVYGKTALLAPQNGPRQIALANSSMKPFP